MGSAEIDKILKQGSIFDIMELCRGRAAFSPVLLDVLSEMQRVIHHEDWRIVTLRALYFVLKGFGTKLGDLASDPSVQDWLRLEESYVCDYGGTGIFSPVPAGIQMVLAIVSGSYSAQVSFVVRYGSGEMQFASGGWTMKNPEFRRAILGNEIDATGAKVMYDLDRECYVFFTPGVFCWRQILHPERDGITDRSP